MLFFLDELLKAADDLCSPSVTLFALLDDEHSDKHQQDSETFSTSSFDDDIFDLFDDD